MDNRQIAPPPATSIPEVIRGMQAIDDAVKDDDGLKWFNFLYLAVTQAVDAQVATSGRFSDPAWIVRLDIAFANLYFEALRTADSSGPRAASHAWKPLLTDRKKAKVARIQFALAGMNAHINRDLVFVLVDLYQQDGTAPDNASSHFADFTCVNACSKWWRLKQSRRSSWVHHWRPADISHRLRI